MCSSEAHTQLSQAEQTTSESPGSPGLPVRTQPSFPVFLPKPKSGLITLPHLQEQIQATSKAAWLQRSDSAPGAVASVTYGVRCC